MNISGAFVPRQYNYCVTGGPFDINVCPSDFEAFKVA
jgi:hypothetical protein